MKKILSILFLTVLAFALTAQEVVYETFESGIDIWILVPYSTFIFRNNADHADYQFSIQIKNQQGRQVHNQERVEAILNRPWLQGTAIPIFLNLKLDNGIHNVAVTLRNRDLGDKRSFTKTISISNQATEIGQAYLLATRDNITFIPRDLISLDLDNLILKQQYSLNADSIRIQIDHQQYTIRYPESPLEFDLKQAAATDSIHTLKISYYESNIQYIMGPFLYSEWFSYGLRYSLKDQINQIRYIASQNEWKKLHRIPDDKKAEAIENFWKAKDPSPGTVRNEAREEFYSRVISADEQFSIHKKMKGWASDRGRIYIKYGHPDEITNDVYPIGKAPSIVWTYYKQNLEFNFEDTRGFGQYTLRNKDEEY